MRLLIAIALLAVVAPSGIVLAHTKDKPPQPEEATEEQIVDYYESGLYERDTKHTLARARKSLRRQLDGHRSDGKDAIVLDIDDTSLSTYECQRSFGDFGSTELAACVVEAGASTTTGGDGLPAITPTRSFFNLAQRRRVHVEFITGRPALSRPYSIANLRAQGFRGDFNLVTQDDEDFASNTSSGASLVPYKSAARKALEKRGFEILVNVGDQRSDLRGGHANATFLVPNPMYLTH